MVSANNDNRTKFLDCLIDVFLVILATLPHIYSRFPISSWILLFGIGLMSLYEIINKGLRLDKSVGAWFAFTAWLFIGCIYTNDYTFAIGNALKFLLLVLSFIYLPDAVLTDTVMRFIKIFVSVSVLSVIADVFFPNQIGIVRNYLIVDASSITSIQDRIAAFSSKYGIFADSAVAAFFAAAGIAIGCYYLCFGQSKRVSAVIWIALSVTALILTNKRGPMMSAVFAAVILFLVKSSYSRNTKIRATVVIILIAGLATYLFNTNATIIGWVSKLNENFYSTRNRSSLYLALWNNFKAHPLLGSGTKSTRRLMNGLDGHNIYLAALSENGILGLITLLFGLFLTIKNACITLNIFKNKNDVMSEAVITFCIFMQLYIIAYGMTGNPFTNLFSMSMYFMCVGIPIKLRRMNDFALIKEEQ